MCSYYKLLWIIHTIPCHKLVSLVYTLRYDIRSELNLELVVEKIKQFDLHRSYQTWTFQSQICKKNYKDIDMNHNVKITLPCNIALSKNYVAYILSSIVLVDLIKLYFIFFSVSMIYYMANFSFHIYKWFNDLYQTMKSWTWNHKTSTKP